MLADHDRRGHVPEGALTAGAIVAAAVAVPPPSLGLEADGPPRRQMVPPLADGEGACGVDGGVGAQGVALFGLLLEARLLVVAMQGGHHAIGDEAGPKRAGGALGYLPVEDALDLLGSPPVPVLPDACLEETPAGEGRVPHLGQGARPVEEGEGVPIPSRRIGGGEGGGRRASQRCRRASRCSAPTPSARACARAGAAQDRMPLSSGSKAMPAVTTWRLRYSGPLRHRVAVSGKSEQPFRKNGPHSWSRQ